MPLTPAYNPSASFANDETNQVAGRSTVRTAALDTELANISSSINASKANLEKLQRDDGKLRDGCVELYHLSPSSQAALQTKVSPRGQWASATVYAAGDLVEFASASYVCPVGQGHTSGAFATDHAAGKWQLFGASGSAGAISFTPPSTMSATNVQAAIEEVNSRARNTALPVLAALYGAF